MTSDTVCGQRDVCTKCNDGEPPKDCKYYGEPCRCNSPLYGRRPTDGIYGNSTKMCEALKQILALAKAKGLFEIQSLAETALAEPPRNCDVGTAEEQQVRHCAWCRKHGIDGNNEVNCTHQDMCCDLCALRWAQMPYEEGGVE